MTTTALRPPLERRRNVFLGGVCLGLAVHLGWSVQIVRILFVLLTLLGGAGVLLYLWLWALVPLEASLTKHSSPVSHAAPVAAVLLQLAGLASVFVVALAASEAVVVWLVAVTLLCGAAVAWSLAFDRTDPRRSPRYRITTRAIAVALLFVCGLFVLISRPSVVASIMSLAVLALAALVFVSPLIVQLWADLLSQRAARVRQDQRAEIAAHLHDSVLQTLALIQNRAGASSEVARIARAQERELRDWLFTGDAPLGEDLASALREIAAAVELDYPARVEVVSAGAPVAAHKALVAAGREAMFNAARHAGGTVSVYVESNEGAIDVFVRDRGPGVDLSSLPKDRLGIRESIIGRMARAGGTGTVRATETGTEVHLHLEVSA